MGEARICMLPVIACSASLPDTAAALPGVVHVFATFWLHGPHTVGQRLCVGVHLHLLPGGALIHMLAIVATDTWCTTAATLMSFAVVSTLVYSVVFGRTDMTMQCLQTVWGCLGSPEVFCSTIPPCTHRPRHHCCIVGW